MNKWTLQGRKALVTGGTKGIGLAICEELTDLGAEVIAVARNPGKVNNDNVTFIPCDVTNENERKEVFERISNRWEKLDILVNNAGTNTRKTTLESTTEDFESLMTLNINSVVEFCRLMHPLLADQSMHQLLISLLLQE